MPLLSLVSGHDLACWHPLGVRRAGVHPLAPKGPKALLAVENAPAALPVSLGLCGPVAPSFRWLVQLQVPKGSQGRPSGS
jgi:hypothetical protein